MRTQGGEGGRLNIKQVDLQSYKVLKGCLCVCGNGMKTMLCVRVKNLSACVVGALASVEVALSDARVASLPPARPRRLRCHVTSHCDVRARAPDGRQAPTSAFAK